MSVDVCDAGRRPPRSIFRPEIYAWPSHTDKHCPLSSIYQTFLILPDIFWIKGNLNMEHPTDVFLSMNDQIKICVTKNCLSKKKYCSIHFCFWLLQTWILHAECKLCLSLLCHELFWFNYPHSAKFCSMLSQESVKNHKNTNFNTI